MPTEQAISDIADELGRLDLQTDAGVDRAEALLAALGQYRQRGALSPALPLLTAESWVPRTLHRSADLARHGRLAKAARGTVTAVLAAQSAEQRVALDQTLRYFSPWRSANWSYWDRWHRFDPSDLQTVMPNDATRLATLAAFAGHPNGRVREVALVELIREGEEALPWLILRASDWVAPIRVRAVTAVVGLLEDRHAPAFIRALPLVLRMRGMSRVNHADLVLRIVAFVGRQPAEVLGKGLTCKDRSVRRATLAVIVESGRVTVDFVALALRDADVLVRTQAARVLAERQGPPWEAMQEQLCTDRLGRLRAVGLELLLRRDPERAAPLLRVGLDDPTRSVRELARHHLTARDPGFDAAQHYRDAVEGEPRVGSIAGLGEVGGKSDWECLFPMLDARPALARAAVVSMARLNAAESRETRLMMVDSESPGVSKDAARTLQRTIWATDEATLQTYLSSPRPHVRRSAVRLLPELPGWAPARHLLALTGEDLRPVVNKVYRRWISRHWSRGAPPAPHEAATIRQLAEEARLIARSQRDLTLRLLDFIAPAP